MMVRPIRWTVVALAIIVFHAPVSYSQEQELESLLELDLEELMDLEVVSASKLLQKLREVPATVRVITAEQIRERGYLTLDEALSDLPGFQFRNILGFNSYIFLRGAPSQNNLILVLVDGIQINELNSGGFYGGGQYNLSNVKQIEVVYGPSSALYGTNAVSGIVNLITNDPKDIDTQSASVLLGNFGTRSVDFQAGLYDEDLDLGVSISGLVNQTEKADLRAGRGDNNWTDNMENFENNVSFDAKLTYKGLQLGFVFQDKQASRTTSYKTIGTDYLDRGTNWHIRFINGQANYFYAKSNTWSNQSRLYYRNATVVDNTIAFIRSTTGATGGQAGYFRPNSLIGFENQVNYMPSEQIGIIIGAVAEREWLSEGFSKTYSGSPDTKPPLPPEPVMLGNRLVSLYTQIQLKFIEYMQMTLGVRHDDHSVYGKVNTPRYGVVYNRDRLTTKLLYMEAFRGPKPWDFTWGDGNPSLKPELMKSWELSMGYLLADGLRTDVSIYSNTIKGILTKSESGNRWINGLSLDTFGYETSLEYIGRRVKSYFNYTYAHSADAEGEEIPEIGRHNANIGILYAFTRNLKLDVRGNYLGRRKNVKTITATGSDYIDDTFIINSTLSILNLGRFDLFLIAKNLLNTEYYHTSNGPPDRYRQPQRTVLLRAEVHF